MGIDGIGKRGGATGVTPPTTSQVGGSQRAGESFASHLERAESARGASPVDGAQALSPLQQLQSGQIQLNEYLDLKVEAATQHLSALPPADLQQIKNLLRDELAADPGLRDLVQQATGQLPTTDTE